MKKRKSKAAPVPPRRIDDVFAAWHEAGYVWSTRDIERFTLLGKSTIARLRAGEVAPHPRTLRILLQCLPGFETIYKRVVPYDEQIRDIHRKPHRPRWKKARKRYA